MLMVFLTLVLAHDETLTLGTGQSWYEQDKSMAQQIEGILDYQSAGGRVGMPTNYRPFRVVRQDATGKVIVHPVFAPGHETTLALNVGQRIRMEAKVVVRSEGDGKVEELWVGKLTALGPAPANAFSEIKPIARTNRFQPQRIRQGSEASTLVIRSAKEAAQQLGQPEGIDGERTATHHLAGLLGVKTIDWKNQMLVYVGIVYNGRTLGSKRIEITKLDVNDRGVIVTWKQDSTPQVRSPFISETILIPRVEGEVTFKKDAKDGETAAEVPERAVPQKVIRPVPTQIAPAKR